MAKGEKAAEGEPGWLAMARANKGNPKEKPSVKKGPYLTPEGARKLAIASVVEELDESLIIDALIRTALSSYKAYGPGRKGAADGEEAETAA